MSTGLIDQTCIATSVIAVFNRLPDDIEKYLYVNASGGHNGSSSPDGSEAVDAVLARTK